MSGGGLKMYFADIHCHALAGVDDGAADDGEMFAMIDAAYADHVRLLCFTPHWQPSAFGDNRRKAADAFRRATDYVAFKRYDMRLFLANELRSDRGDVSWLADRLCKTLGGGRSVLVDFSSAESVKNISDGVYRLLGAGYKPVLAHAERYSAFGFSIDRLRGLRSDGVMLQIDAGSLLGRFGLGCRIRSRALLEAQLVDIAASDAHNTSNRPTELTEAFGFVEKKYGRSCADTIFRKNPEALLKS